MTSFSLSSVLSTTLSRRAAAIGLTAALTLAPMPALLAGPAGAAPAGGAPSNSAPAFSPSVVTLPDTVITPGREIGLAGTDNTRLLAGYHGADGKVVNNLVLRSDNLSEITGSDVTKLQQRKLGVIVDLRTDIERTLQPDRAVPGATWISADYLGSLPPTALIDLKQAYGAFVTDAQTRTQIRKALLAIKDTTAKGETALFHCSAGKDRTGWTAAVLLTILGVDRATINADYLASNHYRGASADNPLDGVNMGLLNTSYDAVTKNYGTFDNYLHKGLGLSDADLDALRAQLLTDDVR